MFALKNILILNEQKINTRGIFGKSEKSSL